LTLDEARLDGSHRDHQLRLADGQVIKLAKARNGEPEVARAPRRSMARISSPLRSMQV